MDPRQDQELARLLVQAQDGDSASYEKFLIECSRVLEPYLSRRMHDRALNDLVPDVLQDTLLTIHRARHTYIPGRPVGPWLYAICSNRMIDFFRKYRRVEENESTALEDAPEIAIDAEAESSAQGDTVLEALEALPEKQRQVIELMKMQDLSVKETAARLGMSESSVKVTAFRGYQAIRRFMGVKEVSL